MHPLELDSRQASGQDSGPWALEEPPVPAQLGADAGQACEECGGPMRWTIAHTAVMCPACPAWSISDGTRSRAAVHGQALAHREARSRGEVAARTEADEAADRAARVRLRGQKEALAALAGRLADDADPADHDRPQFQRSAFEIRAIIRGYLPEIHAAANEATLTAIAAEIRAISESQEFSDLRMERDQTQVRRDQQQRYREYAEQERAQAAALERQAAAEQLAGQRRQPRALEQKQPSPAPRPRTNFGTAAIGLAAMIEKGRQDKEKRLAARGACDFQHRRPAVADRLYGIQTTDWDGQGSGHQALDAPAVRACRGHFEAASQWIEQPGRCPPGAITSYWELEA
jgi:ferritin-like protein